MTVAYQGEPGAYSEAAVHERFGPDAQAVSHTSFWLAVRAILDGEADGAVIPVRNSKTGSVWAGAEAVAEGRRAGLWSRGEVTLVIRHSLLALPGVGLAGLARVRSHPEALRQCSAWLAANLPHAVAQPGPEGAPDTAGAAREIAEQGWRDAAAIAHASAAARYGLVALASGIQDADDNATTFAVLSREGTG